MTGAVLDRPRSQPGATPAAAEYGAAAPGAAERGAAAPGGGTLEDLLSGALHETRTNGSTDCPVCHARMTLTRAHAACGGCGSRLS